MNNLGPALQADIARIAAESATNPDYIVSFAILLSSATGIVFLDNYREDPEFRKMIEDSVSACRTLDTDGNIVSPFEEMGINQDELPFNNSSLTDDSSFSENGLNGSHRRLKRSFSESDISSIE